MTTPNLASHITEGARFMASPYRTGLHVGDIGDVPELPFSVICMGGYLDSNEEGYWKGHWKSGATLVGHCELLEEASEVAQTYLKRDYFVFDIPVVDNDLETEPVTFDPYEFWVLNAQGEVVLIADDLTEFQLIEGEWIAGEWILGQFKYPTGDLRKFTWLTRLF